jgi:antitoxin component YwqK of YwqJK toxin-antitoxin module
MWIFDKLRGDLDYEEVNYWDNGQKQELGRYKNGYKDGWWTQWHKNSQISSETLYSRGFVQESRCFYASGAKSKIFISGVTKGDRLIEYYESGQIETKIRVLSDEQLIKSNWFENGNKRDECTYVNNLKHGRYSEWHENGLKFFEINYCSGELYGAYRAWHDNGQTSCEQNYGEEYGKQGQLDGSSRGWHSNGQLAWDLLYKKGTLADGLWRWLDREGKTIRTEERIDGELMSLDCSDKNYTRLT